MSIPTPHCRFRFNLRTLFAVSAVIAVAAGWYGLDLRFRQRQRLAIDAIGTKGGIVWYDRGDQTTEVVFTPQPGKGCGQVVPLNNIYAQAVTFSDQDLAELGILHRLRNVDFTGSQVSVAAIEQFRQAHPTCEVKP